jgi:hypothetical protein
MANSCGKPDDCAKSDNEQTAQPLKYRTRSLWLLGFYILLIVVPWVLKCVLAHRPINSASYIRPQGFSDHEVTNMRNWRIAVDVLNSIAGLITSKQHLTENPTQILCRQPPHANQANIYAVPILSAVLAQAAVLFCQRRKSDEFLSLKDMFVLADREWTNAPLIWSSIRTRQKSPDTKSSAAFLLPAACLIFFGAIQQPLYQIVARVDTVSVATCRDIPSWYRFDNCTGDKIYKEIGRDIEPAQMAIAEQLAIRSRVASELSSISVDELQPNLWSVNTIANETYDAIEN